MPKPMTTSPSQAPDEPGLHRAEQEPKGVLQKNLKPMLYLGAAILVIVAAVFSGSSKKSSGQKANGHQAPQPTLQDTTDNNVQDLKSQVAAAEQKAAQQGPGTPSTTTDPALANATPAQQAAAAAYGPAGQPIPVHPRTALRPAKRIRTAASLSGAAGGGTTRCKRPRANLRLALRI